jgi:hypothetical protein
MARVPRYYPPEGWNSENFKTAAGLRLLRDLTSAQSRWKNSGIRAYKRIWKRLFENMMNSIERDAMNAHRRRGGKDAKATVNVNPMGDTALWGQAIDRALRELGIEATVSVTPVVENITTGLQDEVTSMFYGRRPSKTEIRRLKPKSGYIANQVTGISNTTRTRLQREIQRAIDDRLTIVETVSRLRKRMPQIAMNRIPTIARTEMGRAADRATIMTLQSQDIVTHISVVGCRAIEKNSPVYKGVPTCNIQDVPIEDAGQLTFHPNHTGTIVSSRFREPREELPQRTPPPQRPTPAVTPPPNPSISAPRVAQPAVPRQPFDDGRPVDRVDGRDYMPDKQSNASRDLVQVSVDSKALDANWQRNSGSYIGAADDGILSFGKDAAGNIVRDANGKPIKKSRKEWFKDWLEQNPNTPIETPIIGVDSKGIVDFTNGRHRTSVLINDLDAKSIIVTVDKAELPRVKEYLGGVEVPKTRPKPKPVPKPSSGAGTIESVGDIAEELTEDQIALQRQHAVAKQVDDIHKKVLDSESVVAKKVKEAKTKLRISEDAFDAVDKKETIINAERRRITEQMNDVNLTGEQRARLAQRRDKIWNDYADEFNNSRDKIIAAERNLDDAQRALHDVLFEGLDEADVGDWKNVKTPLRTGNKKLTPKFRKMLNDSKDFLDRMSKQNTVRFREIDVGVSKTRANFRPDTSAWRARKFDEKVGKIEVRTNTTARTIVHELMHGIEYANPDIVKRSAEFLNRRIALAKGRMTTMRIKFPKKNYNKNEWVFESADGKPILRAAESRGETLSYYGSKFYRENERGSPSLLYDEQLPKYDPKNHLSNEVMTVGTEMLYSDPIGFARSDPEWFKFVLGNLRNEYVDDVVVAAARTAE